MDKECVKEESWQIQTIHSALEKAESEEARFAEHDAVKDWLKTWGTTNKRVPPKCK